MRIRNYKAEYARRIAQGISKGLSKSQARGHPAPGQLHASGRIFAVKFDRQLEAAVKEIRSGKSLTKASKSVGVSAERVRNYMAGQGIGEKVGGRWQVGTDNREREIMLFTSGEALSISVRGYERSRKVGEFMRTAEQFLETGDPKLLAPFVGKSVRDTSGVTHVFETDPNTLYQLSSGGSDDFSQIYRINS